MGGAAPQHDPPRARWIVMVATGRLDEHSRQGNDESEQGAYLARSRRIAFWAQVTLLLGVAGSASTFGAVVASEIDLPPEAPSFWSPAVFAAASFLAVVVLAGTGLLIGRKLRVTRT
jgi:hypothetical protein